jgi:hypothetical protein
MMKCRVSIDLMACGYEPAFGECGAAWDAGTARSDAPPRHQQKGLSVAPLCTVHP